jgi:hypothetical protein
MNLLETLKNSAGTDNLEKLGQQFGIDESAVSSVLGQVVPQLGGGLRQGATASGGLEALMGALQSGNHQRYLDDISAVASQSGVLDGNNILGHILGSKDASRAVAARASEASGVSTEVVKQMLPMIATLVMGALSKQTGGGEQLASAGNEDGLGGMLSSMLDSDGDGSAVDDVLDLAKKFL